MVSRGRESRTVEAGYGVAFRLALLRRAIAMLRREDADFFGVLEAPAAACRHEWQENT